MFLAIYRTEANRLLVRELPATVTTTEAAEQWLYDRRILHDPDDDDAEVVKEMTIYTVSASHKVDVLAALEKGGKEAKARQEAEKQRQMTELLAELRQQTE